MATKLMTKPLEKVSAQVPACRFCEAGPEDQSVKGKFVYGGRPDQHFFQCARCSMIYLYPIMTEAEESRFYNAEFERYMAHRAGKDMDWSGPQKHVESNQREVKRRLPFLKPFIKKGRRVLEIGCSSGFMLSALKKNGMEVYGIDPSGGFIDFVRSQGITVFRDLPELKRKVDFQFDLILHYYVLEHIRHPVEFLREYLKLLRPSGVMLFEVPCATDSLLEVYKIPAFQRFYWSVAHHWYFNPDSLARVLAKVPCPFKLLPEQRYDISNHMVWMQEGKPGGYGRYSHVFGEELDRHYKDRLKEHWLCDTLVAMVQPGKKRGLRDRKGQEGAGRGSRGKLIKK